MNFTPQLQSSLLIKRYKRFLVDVETAKLGLFTIHCANTGAMTGCAEPGSSAWCSTSPNPKRKYPHSLELVTTKSGHWIGVNTHNANKIVKEALLAGQIDHLKGVKVETEVTLDNSRLEFKVTLNNTEHFIEVKSVTLCAEGSNIGYFPDTTSTRANKHLQCLTKLAQQGKNAWLIDCVQYSAILQVRAAKHIAPEYAELLNQAKTAGVIIKAFFCEISPKAIELTEEIPVFYE